jgi:hypothetical protein
MNLYLPEEVERINKSKEQNDKFEEFFNDKRGTWNKNIEPLFVTIRDNFTLEKKDKIIDVQSLALSYRQTINEEISYFLNKRSKEEVKLKKIKQDKFVFYATGFGLKTNMGEKSVLIDAHIAENERSLQLIDVHVDFLRNSSKSLEALGFTIKNIIELMNYLGR